MIGSVHGEAQGAAADRQAIVVQHRHIKLDQLDARAELGQIALPLSEQPNGDQKGKEDRADSTRTHPYTFGWQAVKCGGWRT